MGRASQPQAQTAAPGYAFAWASSLAHDAVTGIRPTVVGTGPTFSSTGCNGNTVRRANYSGAAANLGNLNFSAALKLADVLFNSGGGTLHMLVRPHQAPAGGMVLASKTDNNAAGGWSLTCDSGAYRLQVVNSGTDGSQPWTTAPVANAWVFLSFTTNGSSTFGSAACTCYTNGRPDTGTNVPGSGTVGSEAAQVLTVGGTGTGVYAFGNTLDADADIALFALCRRRQTPGEVMAVVQNPWSIFSFRRFTYADVAGAAVAFRRWGLTSGLTPLLAPTNVVYEA